MTILYAILKKIPFTYFIFLKIFLEKNKKIIFTIVYSVLKFLVIKYIILLIT